MRENMKRVFETRIKKGSYKLDAISRLIDMYHIGGQLSDDDRDHLRELAKENAKKTTDAEAIVDRLNDIEKRLAAIEEMEGTKRVENR